MARRVEVVPEEFTFVKYDRGRLTELLGRAADEVGLPPDVAVRLEVDERTPLGASAVTSLDPITLVVESGALEDAKRPRHLSERNVLGIAGRLLHRVKDRLDSGFAAAPADAELTLPQQVAWDVYAVGRSARLGYPAQKARRLYHFRIRHGFSDTADTVFERLWSADALTWADIEAACHETGASEREAERKAARQAGKAARKA